MKNRNTTTLHSIALLYSKLRTSIYLGGPYAPIR